MAKLSELSPRSQAELLAVGGERALRRRLMELGLLPGTLLRVVRRVDVGDVLEIEFRGCHLCLRRGDAARLEVRPARA
ncbi:MAG: FeoA family protein [Planctomycetota bacterium]|nr:FeoA family protein [Planctomycetota bacterium]MDP6762667.1 FeoA family protein [Planctomycetota bacterium]MDP6989976.1 FeoA family protein [Planctomycetota bacterium]